MRHLVAISVISLPLAWALSTQGPPADGAQFLQQPTQPGTENPPDQAPVNPPPRPAPVPNRPGPRFRFNIGSTPVAPPGTLRTVPGTPPAPPEPAGVPGNRPTAVVTPARPLQSVFLIPAGLSMPARELFDVLGVEPVTVVPLTPITCFDIAYKCYLEGMYSDAVVFARHGLTMCNDARLHLIKGVCELHLARGPEAEHTAAEFRTAFSQGQTFGLEAAMERVNDPLRVRFDQIVEYQNTGR
jgi:hypothetical protein